MSGAAATALATADWRRCVFELYSRVRALAPSEGHELWRRERDELFRAHPATPLLAEDRSAFSGLDVAPYDPAWRFTAPILPAAPQALDVETGTDGIVSFERIGLVQLDGVGGLDVWRLTSYGGGLFVPIRDGLSRVPGGTYGGGRYLIDTIKGADLGTAARPNGQPELILDFNFAYNPSCAYDPEWACPLAPPGNILTVDIPAGEHYTAH